MVRKIGWAVTGMLLGAALAVGAFVWAETRADDRVAAEISAFTASFTRVLDEAMMRQEQVADTLRARFEEIDDLKTAQERRLRRYRNSEHLQSARALGVGRVSGKSEIDRLVERGRLVGLEDNRYYAIQKLDYSVPYVTPHMAALLDRVGVRFHERLLERGLPLYRFVISSVTRTAEDQRALRQINPNATFGISTHEFGTTVDVVYHKYRYHDRPEDALPPTSYAFVDARLERLRVGAYDALGMRYWQELQGILGRVLIELQDAGDVKVTLERQQPVFHITVARRLARE